MSTETEELIDALAQKNFAQAETHFKGIIGDKLHDMLDAEKVSVAASIYNSTADDVVEEPFEDDE
jgi:hypothetical protein